MAAVRQAAFPLAAFPFLRVILAPDLDFEVSSARIRSALQHLYYKYNSFQVCREDARGGGVALYVHKDITCSKCISKSLTVNGIFECVTVELAILNKNNIIVSCIYRKPGSNIDTYCENVEHIFENNPHNKTIFLCGDFNIDILKQDKHLSTKHFIDIIYRPISSYHQTYTYNQRHRNSYR